MEGNEEKIDNFAKANNSSSGKNNKLLSTYMVAKLDGILYTYDMQKNLIYSSENSFLKSFQKFARQAGIGEERDIENGKNSDIGARQQLELVNMRNQMF